MKEEIGHQIVTDAVELIVGLRTERVELEPGHGSHMNPSMGDAELTHITMVGVPLLRGLQINTTFVYLYLT